MEDERRVRDEREEMRSRGRECPVPRPGGWVGGLMGFGREEMGKGEDGERKDEEAS